jgi:hypothetical protein
MRFSLQYMPCRCWYFIILYNSILVGVCYFQAAEFFIFEPQGLERGAGGYQEMSSILAEQ